MAIRRWIVRAMLIAILVFFGLTVWIVIQMATAINARAAEPMPPAITKGCPNGIVLFANAWTRESICSASSELCEEYDSLVIAAAGRDSKNASDVEAYTADDVSRTIGDDIIRVVNVRSSVNASVTAQVLNPATLELVKDLGSFALVNGIAEIPIMPAHRLMIIQTIWPAWFSSPTVSGAKRRLLLLPSEWMNNRGGRYCTKQVNGVFVKMNRQ